MFAVGKAGIEANYEVMLKWKKDPLPPDVQQQLQVAKEAAGKKK